MQDTCGQCEDYAEHYRVHGLARTTPSYFDKPLVIDMVEPDSGLPPCEHQFFGAVLQFDDHTITVPAHCTRCGKAYVSPN